MRSLTVLLLLTACGPSPDDPGPLRAWCQADGGSIIRVGDEPDQIWLETAMIRLHDEGLGMAITSRFAWSGQSWQDTGYWDCGDFSTPVLEPSTQQTQVAPLRWEGADGVYTVQLPGEPVWSCAEDGPRLVCTFATSTGPNGTRTFYAAPQLGRACVGETW